MNLFNDIKVAYVKKEQTLVYKICVNHEICVKICIYLVQKELHAQKYRSQNPCHVVKLQLFHDDTFFLTNLIICGQYFHTGIPRAKHIFHTKYAELYPNFVIYQDSV